MRVRALTLSAIACGCSSPSGMPDGGPGGPDAPGTCRLPALALRVATLAGCSEPGTEDGPRGTSRFANPTNVAIAADHRVVVTDFDNSLLRIVDPAGETATLVKRNDFHNPFGLAIAADGTIYVETDDNDRGGHSIDTGTIWRVEPVGGAAQVVARDLGRPRGLAMLPDGRIAMADHMHHTLSILDPSTGQVAPLAGAPDQPGYANATGIDARFAQPYDLVALPGGDLAVADMDNHRIRRITLAGVVTDLAGAGAAGSLDGPADVATFDAPQALALGQDGALYITDIKRHLVRRLASGEVRTVIGDGSRGWLDSDAPRTAKLAGLEGIDADANRLLISDGNRGDDTAYHHIRVAALSAL